MNSAILVALIGGISTVTAAAINFLIKYLENKKTKKTQRQIDTEIFNSSNHQLAEINERLTIIVKTNDAKIKEQDAKIDAQSEKIDSLHDANIDLKIRIKELEEQNANLRSQIQEIIDNNKKNDEKHQLIVAELEKRIEELEKENLGLREENKRLTEILRELKKEDK